MRLVVIAVGRQKRGPLREVFEDYQFRATRTGAQLGLGPVSLIEVEDKTGQGSVAEAKLLVNALPEPAHVIALDERGGTKSSPKFAQHLARVRDDGIGTCACLIGGADGLTPALRDRADLVLSLGAMVWPHMLARAMLAEQLYRATAILAGTPYHRA